MSEDKTKILNDTDPTLRMSEKGKEIKLQPGFGLESGEHFLGYEIIKKLSVNTGEAEVFHLRKEERYYALKLYYPNFQPKYEVLEKLKGIDHPDIINLHEYGTYKDRFYEIQDYAEGGSLSDKTMDNKYKYLPLKEGYVLQVIEEVINAFDYCHSMGIIHRDIKPGNLFFKNANGTDILIGDFGISSELDIEGNMSKRMTGNSRTEGYGAPEVYSGIIGKELDYYALGITVFELLTGKNPFQGRNEQHIMRDTIQGRVAEDLLSSSEANGISPRMKKLIRGLLTVRHEKRWGFKEVSRFLEGEEVPVFIETRSEIPPLKIGASEYTNLIDISNTFPVYRSTIKKMLYRGMLSRWAESFDKDLALKIGDIEEDYSNSEEQEFGVDLLRFLFNPNLNYITPDKTEISNLEELKIALEKNLDFYSDITDTKSCFHAWLISQGLNEVSKSLKETKKNNISRKRVYSYILFNLNEGFQTQSEPKIELSSIYDFKKYDSKIQKIMVEWLKDRDSYLSVWFERSGNNEIFTIWNSGKIKQDVEHFQALLNKSLVLYKDRYLTEQEKQKEVQEENEYRAKIHEIHEKLKINEGTALRKNPKRLTGFQKGIMFSLVILSSIIGFFIINENYPYAILSGILYILIFCFVVSSKVSKIDELKKDAKTPGKDRVFTWKEAISYAESMSGLKIPEIDELMEMHQFNNNSISRNKSEKAEEDIFYWSSTQNEMDIYYTLNLKTGEVNNSHIARRLPVILIKK